MTHAAGEARTLAEWGMFFGDKDGAYAPVELMDAENSILDEMLWKEANSDKGHETSLRTGLPEVYWSRLYKGTKASKSQISAVLDPTGGLIGRCEIDKRLLKKAGSKAAAYRSGEARAFGESMRQKLATAVFYGDITDVPEGIHGFAPRYTFKDAPQVIDAGGTGPLCTSIWGIVWGENDACGIFPKGSKAGLSHDNLGDYQVEDGDGRRFTVVGDEFTWDVGISVRDWRSVVRICNIDTTKLTSSKGEKGFVDLHKLTIQAKNRIPTERRGRMTWYCNEDVMTALEMQASDAGYVQIMYKDLFRSDNIAHVHTRPIRQCDAILSTEEALLAAPL